MIGNKTKNFSRKAHRAVTFVETDPTQIEPHRGGTFCISSFLDVAPMELLFSTCWLLQRWRSYGAFDTFNTDDLNRPVGPTPL
ncbi:MAG: hypothetical protein EA362_08800 [Saprospirales bacterium]|nr:MAG: hypothetical protein EA362_08800 [Saprospirales bacterium]